MKIFPAQNPVSTISQPQALGEYQYWLRDYNGYLAVFWRRVAGGAGTDFSGFTRNLPQYDQQALQDGIGVRDYEEHVARIEDFIS